MPDDGSVSSSGASSTLQVFVLASTSPRKITVIGPVPEPSVVGCTAVTFSAPATGSLGERVTTAAELLDGITTRGREFDCEPSGFFASMDTVPAVATSAAEIVTVHVVELEQVVVHALPFTSSVVPGPGLLDAKLYPVTAIVNLDAAPAVALAGERSLSATAEVSATVAVADCVGSAWLVAVMVMELGLGAVEGAVETPLVLIVPHVPPPHATCQVTAVFWVPVTVAVSSTVPDGATTQLAGARLTAGCGRMVTAAVALREESASAVAVT